MVTKWGFSDKLGPLVYGEEGGQPFMGYATQGGKVSDVISQQIDEEIRAVIDKNYHRAESILKENISILHKMADALMKWETIDKDQIDALMSGNDPEPPKEELPIVVAAQEEIEPPKPTLKKQDNKDNKLINFKKPAGRV
jgi:cell division protease FtsH